jgi:hypothetical protein
MSNIENPCWKKTSHTADALDKLMVTQLDGNFLAICGSWYLVTVFARALHWILSTAT